MKCPHCAWPNQIVVDSRDPADGIGIRRRRKCKGCKCTFVTREMAVQDRPSSELLATGLLMVDRRGRLIPVPMTQVRALHDLLLKAAEMIEVGLFEVDKVPLKDVKQ